MIWLAGKNIILNDVSFKFPDKKNIGVLGVNGAGKSTLLRLIAGSEYADSGKIIRKGKYSWPLGFSGSFHPVINRNRELTLCLSNL